MSEFGRLGYLWHATVPSSHVHTSVFSTLVGYFAFINVDASTSYVWVSSVATAAITASITHSGKVTVTAKANVG
jgi:hypothetical protein